MIDALRYISHTTAIKYNDQHYVRSVLRRSAKDKELFSK